MSSDGEETGSDALDLAISDGAKTENVQLLFSPDQVAEYSTFKVDGFPINIAYGKRKSNFRSPYS